MVIVDVNEYAPQFLGDSYVLELLEEKTVSTTSPSCHGSRSRLDP